MMTIARIGPVAVLALVVACGEKAATEPDETPVAPSVAAVDSPAGEGSGEPHLSSAPDGSVLLSWLEKGEDGSAALRFARYRDASWSPPVTIAEGNDFFVNWADFPSIAAGDDGTLYAHWLRKSGPGVYAYDVVLSASTDGGRSWSPPISPHDDGTQTEHGFVSIVPLAGQRKAAVIWLDGRNMKEDAHDGDAGDMTLRYATFAPDGTIGDSTVLDDRVCECCQTGLAASDRALIAVYRNRSNDEIRDIGIVRMSGDAWSEPEVIEDDHWHIEGCPVNGPQIDARGADVSVAWFSGAEGEARVQLRQSRDGGMTFGEVIRVDDGSPLGRVDVLQLSNGGSQVTWVERTEAGAEVRTRLVTSDGKSGPTIKVADASAARAGGFPRTVLSNDAIWFSWTVPAETGSRVHVAKLPLGGH